MAEKTFTVQHPEAHTPSAKQIRDAAEAAGVPKDHQVLGYVTTSGSSSDYTVSYVDEDEDKPAAKKAAAAKPA